MVVLVLQRNTLYAQQLLFATLWLRETIAALAQLQAVEPLLVEAAPTGSAV